MKIEQYTIINNEFFFFRKNSPVALSTMELTKLIQEGKVQNMTEDTLYSLTNRVS